MIEGYFRFCCPVCNEFNTSVNSKTNLARCFDCRKNYNTIDLVMLVKGSNFIQSVNFLQRFMIEKKNKFPQIHFQQKDPHHPSLFLSVKFLKLWELQAAPYLKGKKRMTTNRLTSLMSA